MAISRIGSPAAAEATTITIPAGHQTGDGILMYAFRSTGTAPSLPAGWTSLTTGSVATSAFRLGYKLAISNADTSGTWTNATGLMVAVYRGVATNKAPFLNSGGNTATGTTLTYSAGANALNEPNVCWLAGFAVTKTIDSTIETAPAGMTNMLNLVGASAEYAAHDTNGIYVGNGNWPSTTVSIGGTSAEWRTMVVEIYPEQLNLNNYQFFKGGDGMSFSERIK